VPGAAPPPAEARPRGAAPPKSGDGAPAAPRVVTTASSATRPGGDR